MRYLHLTPNLHLIPKLLIAFLFFILLFPSCNNEELYVLEESAFIEEEEEPDVEEEPDETVVPVVPVDVVDDAYSTFENVAVTIEPYLNDQEIPATFTVSNTGPSNGTLAINDNNTPDNLLDDTIIYTPNAGFFGTDTFEYTVCDANNTDNCDTAIVTIVVEEVIDNDVATELKAFPSAYGAGAYTTGGRGGQVIHVTNLNDSGAGSLREAILTTGPRIIVFDVSGEIHLTSMIYSDSDNHSDMTIAGQTAPEGGITITGSNIRLGGNNFIFRYLKFRRGNNYGSSGDGLALRGGSDIIIDHCSFSWAGDEAIDLSANASPAMTNITVQNCLFYQNKTGIIVGSNDVAASGSFSVLRNVFSSTSHRFPKGAGEMDLDVINNLHHNWRYRTSRYDGFDFKVNQIGNYYQSGSNTIASSGGTGQGIHKVASNTSMNPQIYSRYNHIDQDILDVYGLSSYDPNTDESSAWTSFPSSNTNPVNSEWFVDSQLPLQGAAPTILLASQLKSELLPSTGACKYLKGDGTQGTYRDDLDSVAIDEVLNDSNSLIMSTSHPDYKKIPSLPNNSRPSDYDTDNDGMPDVWERSIFGNLDGVSDGDHDGDGYTNIEEFLNSIDV